MLSRITHTPKKNLHTHNKAQPLLLQRQCPNKGMQHTKLSNRTKSANPDTTINYNDLTRPSNGHQGGFPPRKLLGPTKNIFKIYKDHKIFLIEKKVILVTSPFGHMARRGIIPSSKARAMAR